MKNKYIIVISSLIIVLVTSISVFVLNEMNSNKVEYNVDTIKIIAYNYLPENIKGEIVTSLDDYYANGAAAQNVGDIWLYASCEEIKLKDIGFGILWSGDEIKERYDTFGNRNKIVLQVTMETSKFMLESVILFVDPVDLEVIGYGLTY